ncbi:DUF3078 domain-containing protein [Pontibacter silvestris]|uniref:DUF3078 domain-containing protein n=1 Tax=Pontibacter silvestris TaxID=2305183 RepID=A0ABW4WUT8_9BACT|nr:DUF3078 domain-containing protein [Pontibacter silvestris]MCC9136352.1 DUF3078 domain-containing protein [Pontibacter silvestris]
MCKLVNSSFFVTFLLCCFSSFLSLAQELEPAVDTTKAWDLGGTGSLNFNQVSLSNWAAGGQNSFSVLSNVSAYGNYKKRNNSLDISVDIIYGTVKLEEKRWRKSDDKFELNVKYGRRASSDWNYSAQFNFKSQLTPTYTITRDTLLSNFLSPATMLVSLGMDYKPNKKLSVLMSPLTGKYTIVQSQMLADRGSFGVQKAETDTEGNIIPGTGEHVRKEVGGYVNIRYRDEVFKNISVQSKLDLFSNYVRRPENIDVNWENNFIFKVNKFISASLFFHMIYDDDVLIAYDSNEDGNNDRKAPRLQLKETFGLGLAYKLE